MLKEIGQFILVAQREADGEFQAVGGIFPAECREALHRFGNVSAQSLNGRVLRTRDGDARKDKDGCPETDNGQSEWRSDLMTAIHAVLRLTVRLLRDSLLQHHSFRNKIKQLPCP